MTVLAHFADEILRRFSLFTVARPFAAIFERALEERCRGIGEGYAVWETRFVPCRGHRGPGHVEFFKIDQVESPFVTLVFDSPPSGR